MDASQQGAVRNNSFWQGKRIDMSYAEQRRFETRLRRWAADAPYEDADCWNWGMATMNFKYRGKAWDVRRLAYTLVYGDIPARHFIKQLCGNRKCVTPAHLEARAYKNG